MAESETDISSAHLHVFKEFERVARQRPENVALVGNGGRGPSYTYGQLLDAARAVAAVLQKPPYSDKTVIGLISENRPEWVIAYLAIVASGTTVVPLDVNLTDEEVRTLVGNAGLKVVFTSARHRGTLKTVEPPLSIIAIEPDAEPEKGVTTLNALLTPEKRPEPLSEATNETAVLIYTSGTTGTPKAVVLTHGNLVSNVRQVQDSLEINPADVFLSLLPLHHTFESTCGFLTPLFCGAKIVYARSLKSKELLEDLRNNKATLMCGVPLLYEKIYQNIRRAIMSTSLFRRSIFRLLFGLSALGWATGGRWGRVLFRSLRDKAGLGSIRLFASGGAALPPEIARFFNLIGFTLLPGYGLSECSPVVSVNRPRDIRFASSGPPLAGIDIRIDSPGDDGIGEILVQGPNNTPGYKDNPEATAALLRDGWLYTGDLGRLINGHLYITGRAKNLIVSAAGKNIYPEELEEGLMASDAIAEAVVLGRAKEGRQGEEIRAIIVPDIEYLAAGLGFNRNSPDRSAVERAIADEVEKLNQRMASFKRITAYDISYDELEKTSSRKIKRFIYK
jgi:long-chain acyl-CoA synthetase